MIRLKSRVLLLAITVAGSAAIIAQPAPRLNSLSREWLQRGTTAELTIAGENLGTAKGIIISGAPGVKAEVIPLESSNLKVEASGDGINSVVRSEGKQLKVRLEIDATANLTEREFRLVTDYGVSNPLPLKVGHLPEVIASDNLSREKAQEIVLPAAIGGVISNAAESHFFRFKAKKGELVILDLNAHRLGSKLDSSLAILDSTGKELARNEDAVGLDSVIEFSPPEDGEFVIELRDFRYQGAGDYKYRLMAGVFPYVRSSFPFGGQKGKTVETQLKGANLDGASKILLNLATDAAGGRQEIRASTRLGLSNPFPFDVSELPSFAEMEPNSAIDQADRVTIPVAIDGRIGAAKDYDAFKFSARKDQRVIFDVQAYRYGSPLDALLILADQSGNVLQRNDDAAGSDARLDYTFKEAGDYILIIEDLLNRGGEDFGYRLTASVPEPGFSVTALPDNPRIRRDGRIPLRVEVNRINGFAAPVTVSCDDLPRGVFCEPVLFAPGVSSGFIVLTASSDAEGGSFPLKIKANASGRTNNVITLSGDRETKAAFLTVLDAAPFSVSSGTLMSSIEQNQVGKIEVFVQRSAGFNGDVKITPEGFSLGRDPLSRSFDFQPVTIKGNETKGTLTLKAKTDSEIAVRNIFLKGEADFNGITVSAYSALVPVEASPIPYVLTTSLKKLAVTALPAGSESAASEAVFTVKAERRVGFTGEIDLKLEGVPEGISAEVPKILNNSNEATIKLRATEKTPTGKEFQITFSAVGMHNDRNYRFTTPPVTLAINAPEPDEKKEPKLANTKP